ncbi:MAG TPA: hypothetical protein DD727_09685 [Clostridiales bacterium]|nr:hypothetical protein [Clostridiales bacterium]
MHPLLSRLISIRSLLRKWKTLLILFFILILLAAVAGLLVLKSGRGVPQPGQSVFVLQKPSSGGKINL